MFDTTVNVFNMLAAIATIAAIILGGIRFVYAVNARTDVRCGWCRWKRS
jgi:hypothetical protein